MIVSSRPFHDREKGRFLFIHTTVSRPPFSRRFHVRFPEVLPPFCRRFTTVSHDRFIWPFHSTVSYDRFTGPFHTAVPHSLHARFMAVSRRFHDRFTRPFHTTVSHHSFTRPFHTTVSHNRFTRPFHTNVAHDRFIRSFHTRFTAVSRKRCSRIMSISPAASQPFRGRLVTVSSLLP